MSLASELPGKLSRAEMSRTESSLTVNLLVLVNKVYLLVTIKLCARKNNPSVIISSFAKQPQRHF